MTLHQKSTIKCVIYPQNLAIKCVQFMKKSAGKRVNTYKGPSLFSSLDSTGAISWDEFF